jgi:hypothetical protein
MVPCELVHAQKSLTMPVVTVTVASEAEAFRLYWVIDSGLSRSPADPLRGGVA